MEIRDYIKEVASSSSAPGGGSVMPLTGALGAALGCMVLEITKEKVKDVDLAQIDGILGRLHEWMDHLQMLSDKDEEVSGELWAQYSLPKETEEEKTIRKAAIQKALSGATEVPLDVMETCLKCMKELESIAEIGRKSVLADVEVGIQHLHTALNCAKYNVIENAKLIKDEKSALSYMARCDKVLDEAEQVKAAVFAAVEARRK